MEIIKIKYDDKTNFLDLLLLADESLHMLNKYLYRGELFALYDDSLKSICVVTQESDNVCELKNIATYEKCQGKGYGSKLLDYISTFYKGKYTKMVVGTGEIAWILDFYQKNGFMITHRIKDFFIENYDHPMFDNGVQLVDMVVLSKKI